MTAHLPHPQLARIKALLAERGLVPADCERVSLAEARDAQRRYNLFWNEDAPELDAVIDTIAPGPRVDTTAPSPRAPIPLRLFYPDGRRDNLPVLVYFHGGGFVLNGVDTHDRLLRLLALRSGAVVVAVSYGLAPENRFPGQLEEALSALAWLRGRGRAFGLDPDKLAIGGDSAGANLALAVQLALRDQGLPLPRLGLLLYGMFSADLDSPSHRAFGGGEFGLSTRRVEWFWDQYLAEPALRSHPLAAPLNAELSGLPPQHVIAAGLDCLLDDSLNLADRLRDGAVPTQLSVYQGVPHSFMLMSAHLDPADRAVTEAAHAVALALDFAEARAA
jgi:acetyl esterase